MKKILFLLITLLYIVSYSKAQTDNQTSVSQSDIDSTENVIQMNDEMFINKIFDYKTGSKKWKYKGNKPAIIDFYANWCGPCRKVDPIMKKLAQEYKGQIIFYKIDTDTQKNLTTVMGIKSIPTIIFIPVYANPQVMVGAASERAYKMAIQKFLLKSKKL